MANRLQSKRKKIEDEKNLAFGSSAELLKEKEKKRKRNWSNGSLTTKNRLLYSFEYETVSLTYGICVIKRNFKS
jgi:hypothetical protein